MLFSRKPKPISVRLIDLATGRAVGKAQIDQADAPESWETVAAFNLDGPWQVLDANPLLKEEALKLGQVDLIVRRPPYTGDGAVFAQPTVTGDIIPVEPESSKRGVRRYQTLPEDFRQVEFLSTGLQEQIDATLAAVRDVLETAATGEGYVKRVVRSGFDRPISGDVRFTLDEFLEIFEEGADRQEGLAILGTPGLVSGGFAFVSPSLTQFYGYVRDGVVDVLCVGGVGTNEYDSPEVQAIADFAFDKRLTLIEWPAGAQWNPDTDEFFQFFDTGEAYDETAPV